MDWLLILAWVALLIGVAGAGFIYARSPSFWITFSVALFKKLWPFVWNEVSRRKSPEDEAKWREEYLSGGKSAPKGLGVTTSKTITQPAKTKAK